MSEANVVTKGNMEKKNKKKEANLSVNKFIKENGMLIALSLIHI